MVACLFERLVMASADDWQAYTEHAFVEAMADGSLPIAAFRHYLVQDYLFLIQFARAHALAVYKGRTLAEMRAAQKTVSAILDLEMDLHVRYCDDWGLVAADLEFAEEDTPNTAYTRFVIDTGLRGDLLDLHVALAPCMIGYAVIAQRLAAIDGALVDSNPYAPWIAGYSSDAYAEVAENCVALLDEVAGDDIGPKRFANLTRLFGQACRLEAAFWQMGLDKA
jgi:thiaminase (transcriptional activator TenA)